MDNFKKNIFKIVREEKLNFILPYRTREDIQLNCPLNNVGVFIHLFYLENIEFFLSYVKNVPFGIDIYLSVVSDEAKQKTESYLRKWGVQNCHVIIKENRGRDISALLVTFRRIMLQYKYVCFVHDKRQKYEGVDIEETDLWIKCLWESVLASKAYVFNVLNLFEKNKELGLLVPPEVAGLDLKFSYSDTWRDNFLNTLKLAEKLNLKCNISKEYPPITLGTVFWCRTIALEKLLTIDWNYEDFQQEPIQEDFTINHAVERLLGYVAQDAGYKTGYIMSDQFAQSYILQLKDTLRKVFGDLKRAESIFSMSISEIELLNSRKKAIISYMEKFDKVYFYGAGAVGARCYQMLMFEKKKPSGFIVSEKTDNSMKDIFVGGGVPVYALNEIKADTNVGIVITVGKDYKYEIAEKLESYGITNYLNIL